MGILYRLRCEILKLVFFINRTGNASREKRRLCSIQNISQREEHVDHVAAAAAKPTR